MTTRSCGNNLIQQTSCPLCNSKSLELQQQRTSHPLVLSPCAAPCETTSPNKLAPKLCSSLQAPSCPTYQTITPAMGIVRPIHKNTPCDKEGFDNPSATSVNTDACTFPKASYIAPQKQCVSVISQQPYISFPQTQCDCAQQVPNVLQTICPSELVNKAVISYSTPPSGPSVQLLNPLQQSAEPSLQGSTIYPEQTTIPTVSYYAEKPTSSPIATYSVSTDPQNPNLYCPHYCLQSTPSNPSYLINVCYPSTVVADIEPMTIPSISSISKSSLSSDSNPQVIYPVVGYAPAETTILQNADELDINGGRAAVSSAIVHPKENYGDIEIVNKINSIDALIEDEQAIALDTNSDTMGCQWPVNVVINVPPVNVPAPSVSLPTLSSCPSPSLPPECALVVPQLVPTPIMPIIIDSSKSKLKNLLPILLISLLGGGSRNCGLFRN